MNARERFVRTLTGQPVDRVPFMKVFGAANRIRPHWEEEHPGIGECIDDLLGFEGAQRGWARTPVNMDPSQLDTPKIVSQNDEILLRDRGDGTIEQLYRGSDYRRHTVQWPITSRKDWQEYKARHLQADDPARFPENWDELVQEYRNRDYPLQLTHRGVYGFPRERMGDEALCYAFYDDPELVHDIMDSYTDMAIAVWEKMVKDVQFDLIECWEDMASKNGPMIGRTLFDKFMAPNYRRIAEFARKHDIPIVLVDSDGYIEDLTGWMLDAGVNAFYPYEILAGNDPLRVRREQPAAGVIGGLRKECMSEGPEAMDRELERARALIESGRSIPGPDHFVMGDVSFANYRRFMEGLRDVVMNTAPGSR